MLGLFWTPDHLLSSFISYFLNDALWFQEFHQDMEQRLERAKSEAIELREKLSKLWDRLHVEYAERDLIFQQYPGHSKKSIDAVSIKFFWRKFLKYVRQLYISYYIVTKISICNKSRVVTYINITLTILNCLFWKYSLVCIIYSYIL